MLHKSRKFFPEQIREASDSPIHFEISVKKFASNLRELI